jgi:hypothetical protein
MLLSLATSTIETQGTMKEADFSIGDPGMMIYTLCNKIYSKPLETMVQEIACNARDAMREAGNTSKRVQITLPGPLDSTLTIRDFGPGISPSRMFDVFVKLGTSTKRTSNIQTGGWGYGAKIPFAYTDNFNISTIVNENGTLVKRIYSAIRKDMYSLKMIEVGEPQIVTNDAPAVDQHTGTTINIPIKREDISNVINAVRIKTQFWSDAEKPEVLGNSEFKYENHTVLYKGDNFSFTKGLQAIIVLLDGIPYPVDMHQVDRNNLYWSGVFYFSFNTGDLAISVSREALQYDDATKEKLTTALRVAYKKIVDNIKVDVQAQPNYLDALSYWGVMNSAFSIRHDMEWHGIMLVNSNQNTSGVISSFTCRDYDRKAKNATTDHFSYNNVIENLSRLKSPLLYYTKNDTCPVKKIKQDLLAKNLHGTIHCFKGGLDVTKATMTKLHVEHLIPQLVCADDIKLVSSGPTIRTPREVKVWAFHRSYGQDMDSVSLASYDSGVYFVYDRETWNHTLKGKEINLSTINTLQQTLGIKNLVGVSKGNVKYLDQTKWTLLDDAITPDMLEKLVKDIHCLSALSSDYCNGSVLAYIQTLRLPATSPFLVVKDAFKNKINGQSATIKDALINAGYKMPTIKNPYIEAINDIKAKYPLLPFLQISGDATQAHKAIKDYIGA